MSLFISIVLTIVDILVIYTIVTYIRTKSPNEHFVTLVGYIICIITVLFIWLYIEPCLYMEEVKRMLYG